MGINVEIGDGFRQATVVPEDVPVSAAQLRKRIRTLDLYLKRLDAQRKKKWDALSQLLSISPAEKRKLKQALLYYHLDDSTGGVS